MTKLADLMVRDPYVRAVEVKAPDHGDALVAAFVRLGLTGGDRPLVCTPATRAKRVIDAKADASCHFCAQAVWMAPSSWKSRDVWTHVVCIACLEKAAGMPPFDD